MISKSRRIVIKPKLRAPELRPEQLARPGLLELLREGLHRKTTLISAPAGYGKTTLLAQWRHAEEANHSFAWVSLDEQDNDPVRLWRHSAEALREVAPQEDFGADVLVGLGIVGTNLVETTLPMLINDLTELPHRVVVVLDDYQVLTEGECHESVVFFVEHLRLRHIHLAHPLLTSRCRNTVGANRWIAASTIGPSLRCENP
jgi:LuxR family transcriptional regulator, maltose regulon positive regulatory protein